MSTPPNTISEELRGLSIRHQRRRELAREQKDEGLATHHETERATLLRLSQRARNLEDQLRTKTRLITQLHEAWEIEEPDETT